MITPEETQNPKPSQPDFYVGYLPVPSTHKKFLVVFLTLLGLGLIATSVLIASSQRSPGLTIIAPTQMQTWTGTVQYEPYPLLLSDSGEIHLLIGLGKYGEHTRLQEYDNQRVQIDGWILARNDRKAIQLAPESDAIRPQDGPTSTLPQPTSANTRVEYVGEIVDGKCFLGAMKPGDGKAHKSCATLCIQGGLPPMFHAVDHHSGHQMPLIRINGSTELGPESLQFIGEPIKLIGTKTTIGSLTIIDVRSTDIERWGG
ncbi:MAG: hypothetical protein AB8C13_01135 [Phycisphaerales bacterium]